MTILLIEIAVIFGLFIANGLFAMTEMAVVWPLARRENDD